jgi:hypothetical protein
MKPDDLQKHMLSTYFGLRLGIVVFSFALPLILYFGGRLGGGLELAPSISDYYYAGNGLLRDWFVGLLFAVAGFLYLYKGFSQLENLLLNTGAVLLAVVALVPCACNDPSRNGSLHGFAAVSFFLIMAFVSIRCAPDTLALMNDEKTQQVFRRRYKLIAFFLIASPLAAVIVSIWLRRFSSVTFFVEAFAIYIFATYWLVKSRELSLTQAETLAAQKEAATEPGRGVVKQGSLPPSGVASMV